MKLFRGYKKKKKDGEDDGDEDEDEDENEDGDNDDEEGNGNDDENNNEEKVDDDDDDDEKHDKIEAKSDEHVIKPLPPIIHTGLKGSRIKKAKTKAKEQNKENTK